MSYVQNGLEHRWGERVRVNIPVRVEAGASPGAGGYMKNLSLSGALMESDCDLRLHTLIEVSIALPAPSTRTAVIKAHVSRKLKKEVGIEWYEFAPNIIRDLLRSALRSSPR
jgi:PilZ domain